jgi:transmembrane sensor
MENEKPHFEEMDELLLLYLKGEANDKERASARKWINEKAEHKAYFNRLKELDLITGISSGKTKYDKAEGWNRVETGYYKKMYENAIIKSADRRRKAMRYVSSTAAIFILALIGRALVHSYTIKNNSSDALVYTETLVPLGSKSLVTLSDGTKVWLNAGSRLRYPLLFGKKTREVYLEGEGYFDVAHDKNKRFLVKTSEITIKVFGTQFNVKAYPEENKIFTTLVKGSVAIEANSGDKPETYLKPNQTAVFDKSIQKKVPKAEPKTQQSTEKTLSQTDEVIVSPEKNTEVVTSWKDSRWIIEGETLEQLAIKLGRRYNVKIIFANAGLKDYKFSGTLTDETFEQVLKIIQLSAPIEFILDHKTVTIKEDKLYKVKYDNMINKTN